MSTQHLEYRGFILDLTPNAAPDGRFEAHVVLTRKADGARNLLTPGYDHFVTESEAVSAAHAAALAWISNELGQTDKTSALSATTLVERQRKACNARDLVAFLDCFADDAAIFELGAVAPTLIGKQQIAAAYRALFDRSPHLQVEVFGTTAFAHVVVCLERTVGKNGSLRPEDSMGIYDVTKGLIGTIHVVSR